MKTIYIVAGARPNFMKIAPIVRALEAHGKLSYKIIHTGQHYDREMNDVFFEELGIPPPHIFLAAGGGSHAHQTGKIMVAFEEYCLNKRPDAVVVVGDVNSTLACSIVSKKLGIPVAHIEAGLRSGDQQMPEEINRIVTDSISDWFFVTEPSGLEHLLNEGKQKESIHYVGHVMVDNLFYQTERLKREDVGKYEGNTYKLSRLKDGERYGVVTLHRPSNVDECATFMNIVDALNEISSKLPLIFPMHPRTRKNIDSFGLKLAKNITSSGPLPYMAFLNLWKDATVVLTDSGGLQEETTALGVPCITIRQNTERPITIEQGTNVLAGTSTIKIIDEANKVLSGNVKRGICPHLWDGNAAERIVAILHRDLQ